MTFFPVAGKVESKIPSFNTNSGLLLLNTGTESNCPGKGRTDCICNISSGGGVAGTANTGGGGGGGGSNSNGGAGGSGVIILSIPTANYTGTTTGSPTVTTSGANTILTFNASGSYTG